MNEVNILLLSSSSDFTTDYVALELEKRNRSYLRFDRDRLHEYELTWDINQNSLVTRCEFGTYIIQEPSIKGIYYRAPTYIRETFSRNLSPEDQLKQSQWISFYRNLLVFQKAKWINSPSATFYSENKMVQLRIALEIGFKIPNTFLSNTATGINVLTNNLVVKSLDTAIFSFGTEEGFVYTNSVTYDELKKSELSIAPVIIQNNLSPKIDYRVTVIGNDIYTVQITSNGKGVNGDWRRMKDDVEFEAVNLPDNISEKCLKVVKSLGLVFGAIDLIYHNDEFYFIEVNPTGEWAWLVDSANHKIYESICDHLLK